jgi:hypothetical protein
MLIRPNVKTELCVETASMAMSNAREMYQMLPKDMKPAFEQVWSMACKYLEIRDAELLVSIGE